MFSARRRAYVTVAIGAVVVALAAGTASADSTTGVLDVSKQVAKIQQQVDALTAAGQSTRTGALSTSAVCGERSATAIFARWGDVSLYSPVPSGDMESVAGWSLKDSQLVRDNEPFAAGTSSLLLGEKGQAASPSTCITTLHPTIRFFAKNAGNPASTLKVSVLYEATDGKVRELAVARLIGKNTWMPTLTIPFHVNLIAAASAAGVTAVSFKFQAEGARGKWTIDDLYVDPVKIR